jgi:hypothetical protein
MVPRLFLTVGEPEEPLPLLMERVYPEGTPRGGQILVDPHRPDPPRDFRFSRYSVRSQFEFSSNRSGRGRSWVA